MKIKISDLMQKSGVQFGTSGVRGPVTAMTDEICWTYTTGFLKYLEKQHHLNRGDIVGIAGDLRNSTDRIMRAVAAAISDLGFTPVNYGKIPSPAIALYGLHKTIPTIMVTGSHIPDDRNGIKFNKAEGEILKADEQQIRDALVEIPDARFNQDGRLIVDFDLPELNDEARQHYINRFIDFFPNGCLAGRHIGLYEHSSVARDCLKTILTELGAKVTSLGRSDTFVSVDTEAIRPEDVELAAQWAKQNSFDCIISTDGDGDRPLVSDEKGNWLRGDVAGILCAKYLGAEIVVTPVSSNTAVEKSEFFMEVIRTRIGSPYVIDAMNQAAGTGTVVGYEANGGFLQANEILVSGNTLSSLPTRDATIVPLCILMLAQQEQTTISGLLKQLPKRFTASDRLKDFPSELSHSILNKLITGDSRKDQDAIASLFSQIAGQPASVDATDGVRITFDNNDIIHLRPSGNAPELRCYNEAETEERAQQLNRACIKLMEQWRH
ncbi:MAG: phosphomannomutase [Pseudomonadota bacterium]